MGNTQKLKRARIEFSLFDGDNEVKCMSVRLSGSMSDRITEIVAQQQTEVTQLAKQYPELDRYTDFAPGPERTAYLAEHQQTILEQNEESIKVRAKMDRRHLFEYVRAIIDDDVSGFIGAPILEKLDSPFDGEWWNDQDIPALKSARDRFRTAVAAV